MKILAANMWSIWNFGDANKRYQNFLTRGKPEFSSFIENSLLYDEVYIPTQDYLSFTLLLGVLGEDAIQQLISMGTLKFLRIKGGIGYTGNGQGVQPIEIVNKKEKSKHPFCSDIEYAVNWAINGLNDKPKDKRLHQKIIDNSIEVDIHDLTDAIKSETYNDIMSSEELQNFFSLQNKDLNKLAGIAPNDVRIYGGQDAYSWKGDEIDTYLLLNNSNLELKLLEIADCPDMTTSTPVGHVLKAKFNREMKTLGKLSSFTTLKEITDIPDFGEAILNKQVMYSDLLELKGSKNGTAFREWFHLNCGDEKEVAKEFIKVLQETPKIASLPSRILRFIITTGLGLIPGVGTFIGTGAGIIDSFFLDKWTRGQAPKFFIENLKQLNNLTK